MKLNDKDFIDKFFEYCEPYRKSGVRFVTFIIIFLVLFIFSMISSPTLVRLLKVAMPFNVDILQVSPLEVLYNYIKIAFMFSCIFSLPFFLYQFGKLKFETINFDDKLNRLMIASGFMLIILVAVFATYKLIFPMEIMLLYGLNNNVAIYTTSLSAIISTFLFTLLLVIMIFTTPALKFIIQKSLFFNYADFIKYKKPIMIYIGILSAIISLPLEVITLGLVFLTFFIWYKLLINFAKKKD